MLTQYRHNMINAVRKSWNTTLQSKNSLRLQRWNGQRSRAAVRGDVDLEECSKKKDTSRQKMNISTHVRFSYHLVTNISISIFIQQVTSSLSSAFSSSESTPLFLTTQNVGQEHADQPFYHLRHHGQCPTPPGDYDFQRHLQRRRHRAW